MGEPKSAGALSWLKQPIHRSGKALERTARRIIKGLRPGLVGHNLRWHMMSRAEALDWTERRLMLEKHFWLFVLGLNNSGTTLIVDLLKTHPTMRWLPNEGQYLTRGLPLPRDFGVPRRFADRLDIFHWTEANDPAPAARIQYDWAAHYPQRPGILVEKSPPNTLRSRWLQHNFRPARFLAITRHPYAVCEGIRRREGHRIDDAARHWTMANEWMLDDIKHLEHCLYISYEDLCARPQDYLTRLQAFLGLEIPFDQQVLAKPRRIHNIDNAPELIRNFNERSLAQLSADDIATIDRIAGPLMERLGYDRCKAAA
jgi:Sulfotransferase family